LRRLLQDEVLGGRRLIGGVGVALLMLVERLLRGCLLWVRRHPLMLIRLSHLDLLLA
jgi:hypothetical protein